MRLAAAMCLAAACKKPPDPSGTGCILGVSPDHRTVVFAGDHELVSVRDDVRSRVPFGVGTCLEHAADLGPGDVIAVLADGWRAIVIAARPDSVGGFEPAQWHTTVACVVDFRTGAAVPLASQIPPELELDVGRRTVLVGAASGWIYTGTARDAPRVFDPQSRKIAPLGIGDMRISQDCQLGENDREAVLVCAAWQHRDASGEHHVTIARIARDTWPPRATLLDLPVPAQAEGVAVTPDGTGVAMWSNGPDAYLRLGDLVTPERVVDIDRANAVIGAVAFDHARVFASVSLASEAHTEWMRVLDRQGTDLGRVKLRRAVRALYPAGQHILVDTGCNLERVALSSGRLVESSK